MTATIPIDTILRMLQPLNSDSKKWIADRLYEDIHAGKKTERMKERLSELSELSLGWDGNNAKPISPRVCSNMKAVLTLCQDEDIEHWVLFPDVDGRLYLDLKSDNVDAGILLSEKSFSYFADDQEGTDIPFASDVFVEILHSISIPA